MATRIYTQSSGAVGVTPSTWNFANQINPVTVPGTTTQNTGSTLTSKTEATGTTSPTARAMGRTVIGPLSAQTISGTIKGQMRGSENNTGANATLAIAVKIVQSGGSDRAVLLAQTASDATNTSWEFATSLTNRQFGDAAENASITLTSQNASAGDYLVIEWGFRSQTTTSRNITLRYGNASATDLAENTTETTDNNPWWEFSANLAFQTIVEADGASTISTATTGVGAAHGTGAGESTVAVTTTGEGEAVTQATIVEGTGELSTSVATTGVGAARGTADGSSTPDVTVNGEAASVVTGEGASTTAVAATGQGALTHLADAQAAVQTQTEGESATGFAADGGAAASVALDGVASSFAQSDAASAISIVPDGESAAIAAADAAAATALTTDGQIENTGVGSTGSIVVTTTVLGDAANYQASEGSSALSVTAAAIKVSPPSGLGFGALSETPISAVPVIQPAVVLTIEGYTKDSTCAALGGCVVKLFLTSDDSLVGSTTSDGSGFYQFSNPGSGPFYAVAYKAGSPDVAGTTVNTLEPS